MNITILGTAAAEGWPAIFCSCETCKRAREVGKENIRSRASIQFGARHKIDLPPDTWFHEAHLGADISKLEHLFITHSHGDHWQPSLLPYLFAPFAHGREAPLRVYGNEVVVSMAKKALESRGHEATDEIITTLIKPFEPIEADDMIFTPILAVHMEGSDEVCLNYMITKGGKNVLYASDTAWYDEETWDYLEKRKFDAIISECTSGPLDGGGGHMDFKRIIAMKERLTKAGSIELDTSFIATHFSHNVGLLHTELEHILGEHQIRVAYDGIQITV